MDALQPTLPNLGPAPLVPGPIFSNQRKASDEQILAAYAELKSVKKVGARLGMCGQSVHERLVKLRASNAPNLFTEAEETRLFSDYNRMADQGRVGELAKEMGRTRYYLARQARRLGITNPRRKRPYIIESMSAQKIEWFKNNPHPRGMLGKTHSDATRELLRNRVTSEETRQKLSDAMIIRLGSMTKEEEIAAYQKRNRKWKSGWRDVGGKRIFFRSRWEANYGRYLQWLKEMGNIAEWEHEPKVFWFLEIKRGTRSYLPDFRITENDGTQAFHEVKGWMDPRSKTKIKRMGKYYPDIKLIVIGGKSYKALEKMVSRMIADWEITG